jgi:hypothetical protein
MKEIIFRNDMPPLPYRCPSCDGNCNFQPPYFICLACQALTLVRVGPLPLRMRWHYLADLAQRFGWKRGVELGVQRGQTLLYLVMKCPNLTMIGIDLWEPQPENPGLETFVNWPHNEYEKALRQAVRRFEDRAVIVKTTTHEGSLLFADESLDFVFIDADHSEPSVRLDIKDWMPKIKATGWICGHDINLPSVRRAVEDLVPGYMTGPNDVWARPKTAHSECPASSRKSSAAT